MFGERARLDPLASQKELLVAESDLNRAQLAQEWQVIAREAAGLAHRAKTLGVWVSSAALVVASLAALRKGPAAPGVSRGSWLERVLQGARLASTVWFALRGHGHKQERP